MVKKGLLLCFCLVAAFLQGRTQRIFSEGLIIYDVKVEEPLNLHARESEQFEGSKMEIMVKNKTVRTDLLVAGNDREVISNTLDTTAVALLNRGLDKYLIRLSRKQVVAEFATYQNLNFQDGHATRKIAGFNCRKAVGKSSDGDPVTVFYTTELVPGNPAYFPEFPGLKGVPLEFEKKVGGLRMTMTANSVDLSPIPASDFDIPTNGYKEITEQEIEQMTGG
jgi:GLPGLI family protein